MAISTIQKIVVPAQKTFTIGNVSYDNVTIDSGAGAELNTASVVKSGYTPLGIVGVKVENASKDGSGYGHSAINRFYIESNKFIVRLKNTVSTGAIKVKVTAFVLYISN